MYREGKWKKEEGRKEKKNERNLDKNWTKSRLNCRLEMIGKDLFLICDSLWKDQARCQEIRWIKSNGLNIWNGYLKG